jgi:hypothetical protein
LMDGLIGYIPPIIPVVIFVAWILPRAGSAKR